MSIKFTPSPTSPVLNEQVTNTDPPPSKSLVVIVHKESFFGFPEKQLAIFAPAKISLDFPIIIQNFVHYIFNK